MDDILDIAGRVIDRFEIEEAAEVSSETKTINGEDYTKLCSKTETKRTTGYVKTSELSKFTAETVTIPQNFVGLEAVMIPTRLEYQLFRICEVDEQDGFVEIKAQHIFYDQLQNYTYWEPTEKTDSYSCGTIIRGVMEKLVSPDDSFDVATDCTDTKKGYDLDFARKNLVEVFLDPENGLCKMFGLSLIRDNCFFYCLKNVGYDRGFVIENAKNLLGVERVENIENTVTRIAPIGKDKDGKIVWLDNGDQTWWVDSAHLSDYTSPKAYLYDTGIKYTSDEDAKKLRDEGRADEIIDANNIQTKLREAAQKLFTDDHVDLPEITMEIDFLSLGDTEEYKQYRDLDKVYLYDIVSIKDTERGYSYSAQVIGVEHDILTGRLNSIKVGNINHWDGNRKIAAWQVPEVDGSNIRQGTIDSSALAYSAITAEALAPDAVGMVHLKAATIDYLQTQYLEAAKAHIHELIAGSITADDIVTHSLTSDVIQAGSITTVCLAAQSITSDKIAAGAITTVTLAAESITSDKIVSNAITANKLASDSVTADKIAAQSIGAAKIAAGAVTADKIDAGAVTTDKLDAGAVTAGKIDAGAVTTDKLEANAVTAEKLAAGSVIAEKIDTGAVTAIKIAAGAITSEKIDTNDISAINATLGTATIATAVVDSADINYLHVKDVSAGSAYFGQAIMTEGVGGEIFISRLRVAYAQMVAATIGDLVIKASDDNYYQIDVAANGNVTATLVQVTPEEIASGHTAGGRTILDTDIVANTLSTTDIYATHALMSEIDAYVIRTDQLFAREATIAQINAMNLSSNTYIQSTIGNWTDSSTITQTINTLTSRINSLGYGTIYVQPDEPNHTGLIQGDIWIQVKVDSTWGEIEDQMTWQDVLYVGSWMTLGGQPKMYVWDGVKFQILYDSTVNLTLQTEIEQNAAAIQLRATKTELNTFETLVNGQLSTLSGDVTEFRAELSIQADQITAAVETVNAKASSFVQWDDPTDDYEVHLGDQWVRKPDDFDTWDVTRTATWGKLKDNYEWTNALGNETYVWNGTEWVLTSDRASEIYQQTMIDQNSKQITLLANEQATIAGDVYRNSARITVEANRISSEVTRATNAETTLQSNITQTADEIRLGVTSGSISSGKLQTSYISIQNNKITLESGGNIELKAGSTISVSASQIKLTAQRSLSDEFSDIDTAIDNLDGSIQTLTGYYTNLEGEVDGVQQQIDTINQGIGTEVIVETAKQYRLSASSTTLTDGFSWQNTVPVITTTGKYIWSRLRYKHLNGNYTYSTATIEAGLNNDIDTTYYQYASGSNASTAPSDGWSQSIPVPSGTNIYIWRREVKVQKNGTTTYGTPARDTGLESMSAASITAENISGGLISVPRVQSTGVSINGNTLSVTGTSTVSIAANSTVNILNASENNAVILNKNGITIASGASIALASAAQITIGTGSLSSLLTDLGDGITDAMTAASVADGKAVNAGTAAATADGKAVTAQDSANVANQNALAALNNASIAKAAADVAQGYYDAIVDGTTPIPYVDAAGIVIEGGHLSILAGGTFTVASGNFSITAQGNVAMTGSITASSGQIGGWDISSDVISRNSGSGYAGYVGLGYANGFYGLWMGGADAVAASGHAPLQVVIEQHSKACSISTPALYWSEVKDGGATVVYHPIDMQRLYNAYPG